MSYFTRATHVAVVLAIVVAGPAAFAQTPQTRKSAPAKAAPAKTAVAVYKTPTCGCCGKWVEHMQANGFATTVTDLPDLAEIRHPQRWIDRIEGHTKREQFT